jgi:cell division initiation protein
MRGYSDEEVDIFLDEVADEFERLFQENMELQDRVQRVEEQIATYSQVRDALEKTLISAQLQSEEIKANANKESELILRDAQLKARSIVNDSYGETQQVQKALVGLKRLEEEFRFKFRSLLEGYLNLLSEAPITTTTAAGAAALGGDMLATPPAAEQATAPLAEASSEMAPEAETAAEAEGEPEVAPASEPEPSEEYEEEIPTEETELAVAEAAPVEELMAEAAPVEELMAEAAPVEEAEAEVTEAVAQVEAVIEEEAAAAEVVSGEMVSEAEDLVEAAADATATGELTLETSAGRARPEDDQTDLDDSRHGFFFGRQLEDIDDTFPGEDVVRKDRTRDFEW